VGHATVERAEGQPADRALGPALRRAFVRDALALAVVEEQAMATAEERTRARVQAPGARGKKR
jgi:hypothetical protein